MAGTSMEELYGTFEGGALSPIDGRDARAVNALRPHISEFGLMKNRTRVEAAWLLHLADTLPDAKPLPDQARALLMELASGDGFTGDDYIDIKTHEATTNHDVQAVERMMRDRFNEDGNFGDHAELIHFGMTSEDTNNLAEGLGYMDARSQVLMPTIEEIVTILGEKSDAWADVAMLGRTHGQPATPTTLGKEVEVFRERISKRATKFGMVAVEGKVNGATGGYNALRFVYPDVSWPENTAAFIQSLGMEQNRATTQVEPRDWWAEYLHGLEGVAYPMQDFVKDMWIYISQGYIKQIPKAGEIGSSTMPQKINPIDFEKAESNFDTFIGGADVLTKKLTQSRLQRDLSDSSSRRAVAPAVAHGMIAMRAMVRGLGKVDVNEPVITADLASHWEVLTEPFQQMMRRYNIPGGYDRAKEASRGKQFTQESYDALLESVAGEQNLPPEALERLRALTPQTYIGYSAEIARGEV